MSAEAELQAIFAALPKPAYRLHDSASLTSADPSATPTQIYNFLLSCMEKTSLATYANTSEGFDPTRKPVPCESIGELLAAIKKKIHLSKAAEEAFILMMAFAVSLEVDGPFLWGHMTGPSSSLKSTFLDILATAVDRVFCTTEFTSFYSGSQANGKDNSLITRIRNKIFCIKDLTPLLQASNETKNIIFGQWRAIYDGTAEKFYNNGVSIDAKGVRFVTLTGVTYVIYGFQRTDMGERFLIFDINSFWTSDGRIVYIEPELSADGNAYDSLFDTMAGGFSDTDGPKIDQLDHERCMCWGLLNHYFEHIYDESHGLRQLALTFKQDRANKAFIDALATWMEHARCQVPPKNESMLRPRPAEPHRSIKTLSKLALCLAIVLKADHVTEEIANLVKKLAFDTAKSLSLEIMNYLACYPMTSKNILASKLMFTATYINWICEHLVSIGVIEEFYNSKGTPGRPSLEYRLMPRFRVIADTIGLTERSHSPEKVEASFVPTDISSIFKSF